MAKKILFTGALALFVFSSFFSGADVQNKNLHKPYTTTFSDSIIAITDVFTEQTSFYDLVSNAVPQHIVQQSWDTIHLVFMKNLTPGIPSADRRVVYVVSTDGGANWTDLGSVFGNYSSGYPYIDLLTDGRAVIGAHTELVGYPAHSVIAVDSAPLAGTFNICDPNLMPGSGVGVWPRLVTTPTGEIPCIASINSSITPNTYTNILTSINNCTFSGWLPGSDIHNAERYAIARASNGKIGIAYIRNDFIIANTGDVRFIESTDNGVTWSPPITIYNAQPNSSNFLGAGSGIDLIYEGNIPKVVFDLVWQTGQGIGFPNLCSKVMFWSPDVNGGNPFAVADSTNTPCFSAEGPNDGFTPICKGTIGKSKDNSFLFCTYNVSRFETWPPIGGNHYFDCYIAWSNDGGATWEGRQRLTNYAGPLRDCRYPNLAPESEQNYSLNVITADLEYLSDSIPGFTITGAGESPAQQHFIRVQAQITGVNNNQNNLPLNYELLQNYPNPFNPVTTIKYQLPKPAYVKLNVYDARGKEITKLVNENKSAGSYEVKWNAEAYPSGVYFYELRGGDYSAAKKMVLIK